MVEGTRSVASAVISCPGNRGAPEILRKVVACFLCYFQEFFAYES